jgi:hypothetical protein
MAAPGLDEIATTTQRSRTMKFRKAGESANAKAAFKDVAKSGTHVPAKDFSSKKKEVAAAGTGKPEKGSLAVAKSLPTETGKSTPEAGGSKDLAAPKKTWDGSPEDWSSDYKQSRRKGISVDQWEDSPSDRLSDNAGERKLRADESDKVQHVPEYKQGISAFANRPKEAHGFGHPSSARDGHLRNSGHSGAHRIGKK